MRRQLNSYFIASNKTAVQGEGNMITVHCAGKSKVQCFIVKSKFQEERDLKNVG